MTKKSTLIIKDAKTVAKEQKAQQQKNQKAALAGLGDYSEIQSGKAKTEQKINEAKVKNPEAASAAKKTLDQLVKNTKLQTATVLKKIEEKYVEIKQENKNQPIQPYARESFSSQAPNILSRDALIAQRQNSTPLGNFRDDIRHTHSASTVDPNKIKNTSKISDTSKISSQSLPKKINVGQNKGQTL